jgi:hypothetical protein
MKPIILSALTVFLGLTGCENPHIRINETTNEFRIEDRYYISKILVSFPELYYDSTIFEIKCIDPKNGVSQLSILDTPKGYQNIGLLNDSIIKVRALQFTIFAINKHNEGSYVFVYSSKPNSKDSIRHVSPVRIF